MEKLMLMGLAAGMATCLGALLVIILGQIKHDAFSLLLGFASGVMLALTFLDLLPAALQHGDLIQCLKGFGSGLCLMTIIDLVFNKKIRVTCIKQRYIALGYIIATGIALHDLPEGLAIAAGASEPVSMGFLLALAIGLHNIPEGMATATPLLAGGVGAIRILVINFLISLVTPLGCLLGAILINISPSFISLLLALAGGAMTYIAAGKLLPESLCGGRVPASAGLLAGVITVLSFSLLLQQ